MSIFTSRSVDEGAWTMRQRAPKMNFPAMARQGVVGAAKIAWAIRKVLLLSAAVAVAAGLLFLLAVPPRYTAHAIIAPPPQMPGGVGDLGGSSLAGLAELGSQSVTPFQLLVNEFDSRAVAEAIYRKHPEFLPMLFKSQWDEQAHNWSEPGFFTNIANDLRSMFHRPVHGIPDAEALQALIHDKVKSQRLGSTNIWEATYADKNPEFAARFLGAVLSESDIIVRQVSDARYGQSVDYLNDKLRQTGEVTFRTLLFTQLTRIEMARSAARSAKTYASVVIDGPAVDTNSPSPSALTVLIGFAFIGALAGGGFYLVRYWNGSTRN